LSHSFLLAHHRLEGQEPQQPQLRESAKEQAPRPANRFEPFRGANVVDVPLNRERNPDVDVREKK
jgi:hypothetical protein